MLNLIWISGKKIAKLFLNFFLTRWQCSCLPCAARLDEGALLHRLSQLPHYLWAAPPWQPTTCSPHLTSLRCRGLPPYALCRSACSFIVASFRTASPISNCLTPCTLSSRWLSYQPDQPYLHSLYNLYVVQDTEQHVLLLLHLHDPEGHPLANFCHWIAVLTCQTVPAIAVIFSHQDQLSPSCQHSDTATLPPRTELQQGGDQHGSPEQQYEHASWQGSSIRIIKMASITSMASTM